MVKLKRKLGIGAKPHWILQEDIDSEFSNFGLKAYDVVGDNSTNLQFYLQFNSEFIQKILKVLIFENRKEF